MHTIATTTNSGPARHWNNAAGPRFSLAEVKGRPGSESPVRIGLALGGGFARGIAHAGVLRVLERHHSPIHCVTGISAGAIVAAAYASAAITEEIVRTGCSMRLGDVGRSCPGRMGLIGSQAMKGCLERRLKIYRFAEMRIALGVVGTDVATGEPAPFTGAGEVFEPIRASCAYPGLFQPVSHQGRILIDGAISIGVPAVLARQLGATHVISVPLPPPAPAPAPSNMFQVVSRCFQILQSRTESSWRDETDLVIAPDVRGVDWNGFDRGPELVQAGQAAALASVPKIREWMSARAAAPATFLQMEMGH